VIGPDGGARHGFGQQIGRAWRRGEGGVLVQERRHGLAGAVGQMRGGDARHGLVSLIAPTPRLAGGK